MDASTTRFRAAPGVVSEATACEYRGRPRVEEGTRSQTALAVAHLGWLLDKEANTEQSQRQAAKAEAYGMAAKYSEPGAGRPDAFPTDWVVSRQDIFKPDGTPAARPGITTIDGDRADDCARPFRPNAPLYGRRADATE